MTNAIEVGTVRNADRDVFIAVPDEFYEPCTKPLSGTVMHTVRIRTDDIDWLIAALRKEQRLRRKKAS